MLSEAGLTKDLMDAVIKNNTPKTPEKQLVKMLKGLKTS
jgi:hypothetical protein